MSASAGHLEHHDGNKNERHGKRTKIVQGKGMASLKSFQRLEMAWVCLLMPFFHASSRHAGAYSSSANGARSLGGDCDNFLRSDSRDRAEELQEDSGFGISWKHI